MTRPGKCDICRKRKVKCDETRPKCGHCRKSSRPCTYTYGNFSDFVHQNADDAGTELDLTKPVAGVITPAKDSGPPTVLVLRSIRDAESGDGLFQTHAVVPYVKPKSKSSLDKNRGSTASFAEPTTGSRAFCRDQQPLSQLPREPWCLNTKLIARWLSATETGVCVEKPLLVFGNFIRWIPRLIGQSEAVSAAASCLLESMKVHVDPKLDDEKVALIQRSNTRAVNAVRIALSKDQSESCGADILVAIRILFIVEVMVRPTTINYRYHIGGLTKLLQRVCDDGRRYDEISQSVFYSSFANQLLTAIVSETDCFFDRPTWRDFPPPVEPGKTIPDFAVAWKTSMQITVQLARLIRLVRRARHFPEDAMARIDAGELAQTLFQLQLEPWIETLMDNGTLRVGRTSEVHVKKMVERSFDFPSTDLLLLLLQYWEARIIVCACIHRICTLPLLTSYPWPWNLASVQHQDVQAATYISMSLDHIYRMCKNLPMIDLRLTWPLQVSWGAWHRLEAWEGTTAEAPAGAKASAEAHTAHDMQLWCIELSNRWLKTWHPVGMTELAMQATMDMWSGGDVPEVLKKSLP